MDYLDRNSWPAAAPGIMVIGVNSLLFIISRQSIGYRNAQDHYYSSDKQDRPRGPQGIQLPHHKPRCRAHTADGKHTDLPCLPCAVPSFQVKAAGLSETAASIALLEYGTNPAVSLSL